MTDWSARLAELAAAADVPGAVLGIWADGNEIVEPYGLLNRRTGVETTADSVFHLGSISKPWTSTLIVQLAAEGRLDLDDPVVNLLPEASIDPRITVRQLLTHTSGLDGDVFTDTGRGDDCLERYVTLLADVDQLFEPGTAYSYCNAGFVLLGRIVEVLDGRSWDASLRARLVEPLGLEATVTLPEEAILHRAAVGHVATDGATVSTWQLPRSLGPAGLIATTASDLLRFARTHLNDDRYAGMREPQVRYPDGAGGITGIGLSWRLYDWGGRRLFGHDGTTIGQLAFLRVDPEARLAVCLLTNSGKAPALFESVVDEVFTEYVGVGVPAPPQPAADASTDDRHVGRYERASAALEVLRRDGKLVLTFQATGDRLAFAEEPVHEYELVPAEPLDGDHFVTRESAGQPWVPVTFEPGYLFTSGRVTPRVQG
ncbi:CubicO group peptidase (beta-lactamase class C family) [Kribbella amoyensis]|uniref:CubicO group peptidase (Beta-lactamase class C family) n=1 Tax=Kribbella amoyensis TaxID=996641 RepID=A0A561BVR4_9ACTN|nr:serine hydrolase domain-containing protein [Kribbella amoyensis]TWD82994.1 CubicO group peptidase (beta-lactamase class C family) [Kribbella amoyensis]